MQPSLYDLERIVARVEEWQVQAAAATIPEMRAFCLEEAHRCEKIVERSLLTPPVASNDSEPTWTRPRIRRPRSR